MNYQEKVISEFKNISLNKTPVPNQKEIDAWTPKLNAYMTNPERIPNSVAEPLPIGSRVLQGAKAVVPPYPFDEEEWMEEEILLEEEVIEEKITKRKRASKND